MDKQLYAIVTGGTKGIGRQVVKDLLKKGYYVYTNYSSDHDAAHESEKVFQALSPCVEIIQSDQKDPIEFEKFIHYCVSQSPTIDCIVCNAGITLRKPVSETSNEEFQMVMNVTVNSHFCLIRDCMGKIPRGSRIIFIGSLLGRNSHGTALCYGVAKAAEHALAMNLVKEFEATDTTVNIIAPGFVETEWQKNKPTHIRENILNKTAIKRFATVEEISDAVMFCIDNGYLNGSIIDLHGGYSFK